MSSSVNARFLTIGIIIAILLGALVGWALPAAAPYVSWLGQIFKLSLAMIVMPLVLPSIIDGMNSVGDVRKLGKIGGKTLAYYFSTTFNFKMYVATFFVFFNKISKIKQTPNFSFYNFTFIFFDNFRIFFC